MIQRPKDGIIILGGGEWKAPIEDIIPQTNDSIKLPVFHEHLKHAMPDYVTGWEDPIESGPGRKPKDGETKREEALNEGLLVDWTGIMGMTPEWVPYVGSLGDLGKKNAWISGGHSGHGAFIFSLFDRIF